MNDAEVPTDPGSGLTAAAAAARLARQGPNAIAAEQARPLRALARRLWAPVPWMLEATMLLQLALGEFLSAGVVGGLLVFNAVLGTVQEQRTQAAVAALRRRLAVTATVRRDGAWQVIAARDVVEGDIVRLGLGGIVPADLRLLTGAVSLDQSALTGESLTVDVGAGRIAYAGALVRVGEAVGETVATGARSFFGRTADLVKTAGGPSRQEAEVAVVTRALALANGGLAIAVVAYGHAIGLGLDAIAPLAVTILLAAIPVALPAAFTLAAALGALAAARNGVLIARFSAIHDAAGMDVLCSDKTGTLTQNRATVASAEAFAPFTTADILAAAALASPEGSSDPVDQAVMTASGAAPGWSRTRFTPFDPARKYAAGAGTDAAGLPVRVLKGAPTALATAVGEPSAGGTWQARAAALAGEGHRVIAVAIGRGDTPARIAGLLALSDPPRADSAALITELRGLGIRTVMVTGDAAATATAVAEAVGISGGLCPEAELADHRPPPGYGVYAGVFPEDKLRLVRALQAEGHIVGMCGDGVNDAPALRQAEVGIAVASATDAAKSAAALVLTNPGLGDILAAVRESRRVQRRAGAYALSTLLKKFEMGLVIAAALPLFGLAVMTPLLMVLLLVSNDFLTMALVADNVRPAALPERFAPRPYVLAALGLGLAKAAFSLAVLWGGLRGFAIDPAAAPSLAFLVLTLGSQASAFMVRERGPFWASRPAPALLVAAAGNIALGIGLTASGVLMPRLDPLVIATTTAAAAMFILLADRWKCRLFRWLGLAADSDR